MPVESSTMPVDSIARAADEVHVMISSGPKWLGVTTELSKIYRASAIDDHICSSKSTKTAALSSRNKRPASLNIYKHFPEYPKLHPSSSPKQRR